MHAEEVYARLELDEEEAVLDCGCILRHENDGSTALYHCKLHAEATELSAACKQVCTHFCGRG